jgi:hypothetical protein
MHSRALKGQHDSIKALIKQSRAATDNQLELQSHWGKYLCVLVAGFLENAIGEVYSEFVKQRASVEVARHTSDKLLKISNPKSFKFVAIAKSFKDDWGEDLEKHLSEEGRKDAIDTIMANRHLIAHGRSSGITVARVDDCFKKSIQVINYIEKQCGIRQAY